MFLTVILYVTYKIIYLLDSDPVAHSRYYHALNEFTAMEMFKETCSTGTLTGYSNPSVLEISVLGVKEEGGSRNWEIVRTEREG